MLISWPYRSDRGLEYIVYYVNVKLQLRIRNNLCSVQNMFNSCDKSRAKYTSNSVDGVFADVLIREE